MGSNCTVLLAVILDADFPFPPEDSARSRRTADRKTSLGRMVQGSGMENPTFRNEVVETEAAARILGELRTNEAWWASEVSRLDESTRESNA